jgi:hypothetical protein
MAKREDTRREKETLPITAEVGGEGGSYADGSMQGGEFSGPGGQQRADGRGGASSTATYANRMEDVEAGGVGADPGPADGMKRHPSDEPDAPEK